MKAAEIRALSTDELVRRVEEAHEELRNLRFHLATRQLQNTSRFRSVRQDIARFKTIVRERELAGVTR